MSAHIGRVARRKATRESSRPEQDLRLLLAHVRILTHIEHNEPELYGQEQSPTSHTSSRGPEYERKRPDKSRQETQSVEKHDYDALFEYIVPSSEISVEEIDDYEWDM